MTDVNIADAMLRDAYARRADSLVLIAGDINRPEVQGIIGHCNQNYLVFKDNFELKHLFEKNQNFFEKKLEKRGKRTILM